MRALVFSALASLFVLGSGCASGGSADGAPAGDTPNGGSAGQPNDDGLPRSLVFEVEGTQTLPPRAQVVLKVRALPARVYHLRFALPSSEGDPLDAVLDRAEADTDESGIASVQLTAPSAPTSFQVRASVDNRLNGWLSVTVADTGFATVQVQPRYASALRDITTWTATAHRDKSCADVSGIPPADGPLVAPPAGKEEAPLIPQVPAGTRLAITLRSGHFVGGCTSVDMLAPDPNPQIVEVALLNRPIDLASSKLTLSLALPETDTTWSTTLGDAGASLLTAIKGSSTSDVSALLDAMAEASGSAGQSLTDSRTTEGWDALVRSHWGQTASTKLRDLIGARLAAGRQRFSADPHLFVGGLEPLTKPSGVEAEIGAGLTLRSVAGIDAVSAGFIDSAHVSWGASSDDTVVLGTDLYFTASELAAALAEAAVVEAEDSPGSVPASLADALDCAGLGASLTAAGADALHAYPSCDAACLTSLCQDALATLWRRGAEADGLAPTRVSITATGRAYVNDTAQVAGISGSWLGELSGDGSSRSTGGGLSAAAPVVTK